LKLLGLQFSTFDFISVKQLTTHVQAFINNFPFPFVGVDGQSACNNLYNESGQKESCPLQKGKTYIYRNSFKVLEIYPKIQLVVHWALQSENKDIVCFEVPARIV
jgi:Niemann-Pick C2 protein